MKSSTKVLLTGILLLLVSRSFFAQTTQVLTGSSTFTVPCGVTAMTIQMWGGGGGGGGSAGTSGGSGGGGGAYVTFTLSVSAGNTFTYSVGAGGSANGGAGGSSSINGITAGGGAGGANNGGAGGAGGTTSGGGTATNGTAGNANSTSTGGAGGAAAGTGGGAGGAGATTGNNGTAGTAPGGGGGGGGAKSGPSTAGGSGGAGQIKIIYVVAAGACNTSATTQTVNTCGLTWTDSGDLSGNYSTSQTYTKTFCSGVTGSCVNVTFTDFSLEATSASCLYDWMQIYDGPSVSSPTLGGKYCGTNSPGFVQPSVTNTTGCLTFAFISDAVVVSTGWSANITCAPCPSACVSSTSCPSGQVCYNGSCMVPSNNYIQFANNINACGTSFSSSNSGANSNYSPSQAGCGTSAANLDCNNATSPNGSGSDVPWSIENDIWYSFCPTSTGSWTVSVSATCNTTGGYQMGIFQGTSSNLSLLYASSCQQTQGLSCVQSLTGSNSVVVNVTSTTNCVYIVLDGHAGAVCNFNVNLATNSCSLLPIELMYFNVIPMEENSVELKWATATEKNNRYFFVERSKDAVNFETIKVVDGAGTTNEPQFYSYTDMNTLAGVAYYRIKQTDYNGASKYSDLKAVNLNSISNGGLRLMPNPGGNEVVLKYTCNSTEQGTISFFDQMGNEVLETELKCHAGTNAVQLDLSKLNSGIYFVVLNNGTEVYKSKFVKQ
jgi:hypothetical protein